VKTRRDAVAWPALAGLGLAACLPDRGADGAAVQTKPSGREVTLTHMFNWAPAQFAPMEASTAAFSAQFPRIKVTSTPATGSAWPDKPLAAFAAGTPPDVLSGDVSLFRWALAEQRALTVLDPYIRAEKLDLTDFDPDMLKGGNYDGKQYGLTFFGSAGVFGFNRPLFESQGVKPPDAAWTMADFLATAQQLTRRSGDPAGHTFGLAALPPTYYMESFLYANGARVLDEGRSRSTLDSPEARGTLQWWVDALWKHRIAPIPAEGENAPIPSGRVGMWLMTPHSTPGHRQSNPFDWDVQVLPAGTKGRVGASSDFTYIQAAAGPAQAETWAFVVHMTGREAQERNAREALLLPARRSALPAFATPGQPPANQRAFPDSFRGSQPPSIYRTPLVIELNEVYNALYADAIAAQKVSLEEAVQRTKRQLDEKLAAYRARKGPGGQPAGPPTGPPSPARSGG
jgi:multiple sugar transport system substrate-binding protein